MSERCKYRVLDPNGFFGDDDHLHQEGEDVWFDGVPNEQLEPLNDEAYSKLTAYLNNLDDMAKVAAEKLGRPFVGRPRTLDGGLDLATEVARQNMSIMGNKGKVSTTERAEREETPETGKRGRGRPKGSTKTQTLASAA